MFVTMNAIATVMVFINRLCFMLAYMDSVFRLPYIGAMLLVQHFCIWQCIAVACSGNITHLHSVGVG
jgi:hypothetical protein